jgi:hypothetical protein
MKRSITCRFWAAIVLLISASACSKSSSPLANAQKEYFTFTANGHAVIGRVFQVDTGFIFPGPTIKIHAMQVLPGQTDSSSFELGLGTTADSLSSQFKGLFADTSSVSWCTFSVEGGTQYTANDNTIATSTVTVVSNDGSVVTGTFQGVLEVNLHSVIDTVYITNGTFSANF